MDENYFYCPHCKKHTKQIAISMRESMAINMKGDTTSPALFKGFGKALGSFMDITGGRSVANHVFGKKDWKCCECGMACTRNSDGSIDNIL